MISKFIPSPGRVPASFDTTQPPFPTGHELVSEASPWCGALVLMWSREEPERVGEVCLFPREVGHRLAVGRGESSPSEPMAQFGRQRPGQYVATGPLQARRISRRQLRLEVLPDGRLALENVGSCPLLKEGRPVQSVILREGELVELQHELLLLFTTRPLQLAPMPDETVFHPFGEADALGLVGESPQMWALRSRIAAIAPLNAHVLVLGPSGAGKELVAQGLHTCSPRARKALVARSAATLPEGLITAELFGNIAQYPHQGMPERPGLVGAAHESSLFLDEFGELPQALQTQLLRVLDQGEYQRLGESKLRTTHFRLIAATNRDELALKHDVRARFSARIVVPGLNERREDIPLLMRHLLRRAIQIAPSRTSEPPKTPPLSAEFSAELVLALLHHRYHTHMRELNELLLESLLERQGSQLRVPSRLKQPLARENLRLEQASSGHGGNSASRGPADGLPAAFASSLSREEQHRFELLQRFDFRIGELVTSGLYPANRQSADLHLRQLMARALIMTDGDLTQAVALMGERSSEAARVRLKARMNTWSTHLRERQQAPEFSGTEGQARLEKALLTEYRGFREILEVLPLCMRLSADGP